MMVKLFKGSTAAGTSFGSSEAYTWFVLSSSAIRLVAKHTLLFRAEQRPNAGLRLRAEQVK